MIFNILYFLWVYLSHGMSNEKSVVGWEFPLEYFPLFKWGKKKKKVGKDHYTILDIMVRKKKIHLESLINEEKTLIWVL